MLRAAICSLLFVSALTDDLEAGLDACPSLEHHRLAELMRDEFALMQRYSHVQEDVKVQKFKTPSLMTKPLAGAESLSPIQRQMLHDLKGSGLENALREAGIDKADLFGEARVAGPAENRVLRERVAVVCTLGIFLILCYGLSRYFLDPRDDDGDPEDTKEEVEAPALCCWDSLQPLIVDSDAVASQDDARTPPARTVRSAEESAGFFSRVLFLWAFDAAYKAYCRGRMDFEDLFTLPSENESMPLVDAFAAGWMRHMQAGSFHSRRQCIMLLLVLQSCGKLLHWLCFFRALVWTFTFLQPLLLHQLLLDLELADDSSQGATFGVVRLGLLLAFVVMGQWLAFETCWWFNVRAGLNIRTVLVHFTFRKGLHLAGDQTVAAAAGYSVGQLQNFISTDATKPTDNFLLDALCSIVTSIISTVIAAYQLCSLLGVSAGLAGSTVIAIFVPTSYFSAQWLKQYTKNIQENRDSRGRILAEFLSAMRVVKCFCLEDFAEAAVSKAREEELRWQNRRRVLMPLNQFIVNSCALLGMAVAFTWYALVSPKEPLTAAKAFAALAWVNMLSSSLRQVPYLLTNIVDLLVSLNRLEKFFCMDTGLEWLLPLREDVPLPQEAAAGSDGGVPLQPKSDEVLVAQPVGEALLSQLVVEAPVSEPVTEASVPRPEIVVDESSYVATQCYTEDIVNDRGLDSSELICPASDTADARFIVKDCVVSWPSVSTEGPCKSLFGNGISLDVPSGKLILICGPIGCGKSTLLSVLSRTLKPSKGSCDVSRSGPSSCALVAQRPWLQNDTFRENIVFGCKEEPERLARIIDACGLGPDLETFPEGLDTLVGEEGVQLSGGQRQRISLARAVYSQCETVLLDDVLSALDAHVSQHVWKEVICKELVDRTCVVVTHQVQYCQDPRVGLVLLLGADGQKLFLGTYADLLESSWKDSLGVKLGGAHKVEDPLRTVAVVDSQASQQESRKSSPSMSFVGLAPTNAAEREMRQLGGIAEQDFRLYAQSCGGPLILFAIFFLIAAYYASLLMSNYQLAKWTDQAAHGGEHAPRSSISMGSLLHTEDAYEDARGSRTAPGMAADVPSGNEGHLGAYLVLVGLTAAFQLGFMLAVQLGAYVSSRNLYQQLMCKLLRLELAFFERTPTGQILNRCLKDVAQIDDNMASIIDRCVQATLDAATTFLVLAWYAPWSLLGIPPFVFGYFYAMRVYRWPARDLKRLEAISRSPVMNHFSDSVKGAATICAYKHERRFMRKNAELNELTVRAIYTYWGVRTWNTQTLEFLGSIFLVIACFSVIMEAKSGRVSAGVVGLVMSYAIDMPRKFMWISIFFAQLEAEFVSVERVGQYMSLSPEIDVLASDASPSVLPINDNANAGLALSDVWFRYSSSGNWVLQGLSFSIPLGERVAIVGRTGCGKSSLLAACVRLYNISSGRITVGGRDASATPLKCLRQMVRVLLQDPILFRGTIRSNIFCLPDDSPRPGEVMELPGDELLSQILDTLGLLQLIQSFGGLSCRVEEAGHNYSQGQRQLLCLARTLAQISLPASCDAAGVGANTSRLVLCDEPTASCDLQADATIHRTLLEVVPRNWTVIVVCHRLHYVRSFDKVLVMETGRLAEQGSPAALLDKNGEGEISLLKQMCIKQGVL